MRHKDIIDSGQPNGRRWRAWAPRMEATDEYGPDRQLIKSVEKRIYSDSRWPTQRDICNLVVGALALLALLCLRGL